MKLVIRLPRRGLIYFHLSWLPSTTSQTPRLVVSNAGIGLKRVQRWRQYCNKRDDIGSSRVPWDASKVVILV